ncbi:MULTISPECIES: hypothetical protein [Burkholderia]|uniref:Uncharacterized protein n=1 Tax=Burkholderia pyrrocinia TaxID=60550 RepID=A0A318IVW7_BURPY|nr:MULTISPECIES: hypothetical protein [Burkholderia]PXX38087.1 hypothetical protein NA66_100365 [Burkholderia pyrrocinia]SFW52512.1 hypothetical protein SAMN03159384_02607 [Burkholderia sp. NFACC33-1]SFX60431.1 hypothetical protein SAMN03159408_01753 [Burkholderia sp. NFPP32]
MNSPTRPVSLPVAAALVAALIITVLFLSGLYVQLTKFSPTSQTVALQLASFIENLVFRTGLVYLIVRWHGEHRDQLAFRRPAWLLTVYALCLLVWQIAQIFIIQAVVLSLAGNGTHLTAIVKLIAPVSAVLYAFVAWLAWWFVTRMFRNDALPEAPRGHAARYIAGLAAWLFASVWLLLMTWTVPMLLDNFDDDLARVMFSYVGAVAVPAALVFAGARLGLPRDLVRLYGWRLLGASLAAMASVSVLFYLALHSLGSLLGVSVLSGMMAIVVLGGAFVAYWVWFRVFYAPVGRDIVETSQGMPSS